MSGYVNYYFLKTDGLPVAIAPVQPILLLLAVPASTNAAQWTQIQQSIQYAASKGVQLNVTVIK